MKDVSYRYEFERTLRSRNNAQRSEMYALLSQFTAPLFNNCLVPIKVFITTQAKIPQLKTRQTPFHCARNTSVARQHTLLSFWHNNWSGYLHGDSIQYTFQHWTGHSRLPWSAFQSRFVANSFCSNRFTLHHVHSNPYAWTTLLLVTYH